jgi:hypothetical protein
MGRLGYGGTGRRLRLDELHRAGRKICDVDYNNHVMLKQKAAAQACLFISISHAPVF